ncbi:MAG TPA: transporter [Ramlibacter sp.]
MKTLYCVALALAACTASAQEPGNYFGDPFLQVTSGLPGCPAPRGPWITAEQARVQQHVRSQHGTSCYRVGRCRLPNSYLYDKEIIPRVKLYIHEDGRFADTSLWILGERRIVSIYGCVKTKEQAMELERTVTLVDDVMNVVPFVMVGTDGKPPYHVVGDTAPD